MRVMGGEDQVSMCSLRVGELWFGIDTREVREVLGARAVGRVPLAPRYIEGVLSYRGEVLTTVCFRSLLGLESRAGARPQAGCVLVLEGDGERFGLEVDRVGGVVMAERRTLAENPATLDALGKALFSGVYAMAEGLMVWLEPGKLRPGRLAETGMFAAGGMR